MQMGNQQRDDEQWQQWRAERAAGLASEHGWLSVVGRDWLAQDQQPTSISGFPGLWSAHGKVVTAHFSAADDVQRDGQPVVGDVSLDLSAGDDSSLTHRTVRAEVISRDAFVGVRYRDSAAPRRLIFDGVPCFEFDPAWIVAAQFSARPPRRVTLQTIDPQVNEQADIVGVIEFELAEQCHQLDVFGDLQRPFLNFHDQTNGQTTADWRFVMIDILDAETGRASIDFNRAMNFPFAFLPGGCTCPKPLSEARLNVAITAGERRPEEVQ